MLAKKETETPESIKAVTDELQKASLKLFEMAYKKVGKQNYVLHTLQYLCPLKFQCYFTGKGRVIYAYIVHYALGWGGFSFFGAGNSRVPFLLY